MLLTISACLFHLCATYVLFTAEGDLEQVAAHYHQVHPWRPRVLLVWDHAEGPLPRISQPTFDADGSGVAASGAAGDSEQTFEMVCWRSGTIVWANKRVATLDADLTRFCFHEGWWGDQAYTEDRDTLELEPRNVLATDFAQSEALDAKRGL